MVDNVEWLDVTRAVTRVWNDPLFSLCFYAVDEHVTFIVCIFMRQLMRKRINHRVRLCRRHVVGGEWPGRRVVSAGMTRRHNTP